MSLRENWIKLFHKAAMKNSGVRNPLTLLGFLIFLAFNIFFVSLALWLDHLLKLPDCLEKPWNMTLATPVLLFGLFFLLWSVGNFLMAKGTPVPFSPPPTLVVDGPYAFSRNPMMTGLYGFLFGLGILLNSIMLTFVITPFIIFITVLGVAKIEEPELEMRFGDDYRLYKKRVGMFWPKGR